MLGWKAIPKRVGPLSDHLRCFFRCFPYFRKRHLVRRRSLRLIAMPAREIAFLGKMPLDEEIERFRSSHRVWTSIVRSRGIKSKGAGNAGRLNHRFASTLPASCGFVADQQLSSFSLFICGIRCQDSFSPALLKHSSRPPLFQEPSCSWFFSSCFTSFPIVYSKNRSSCHPCFWRQSRFSRPSSIFTTPNLIFPQAERRSSAPAASRSRYQVTAP